MSKTVITFGTFDVFHVGHLRVIERAASLGDRLVVGVSADALNERKKGRAPGVLPGRAARDRRASSRSTRCSSRSRSSSSATTSSSTRPTSW